VLTRLQEQGLTFDESAGLRAFSELTNDYEKALIVQLNRFQELVIKAAEQLEPHLLANYLKDLATALHSYYDASGEKILVDDEKLRNARVCLILAVKQVLANGLNLLSLSAPEKM
jgi:arginyl-tRNA synthetase